jgi:hypothetical protein
MGPMRRGAKPARRVMLSFQWLLYSTSGMSSAARPSGNCAGSAAQQEAQKSKPSVSFADPFHPV